MRKKTILSFRCPIKVLSSTLTLFSSNHYHFKISPGPSNEMAEYVLYNYTPSLAVAIIALLLFLAATFVHIFLAIKYRLKFLIAFIIGGFFEAIGYAARAVNAHQAPNYGTMPYAMQSVFILLAPSLFAASIYMVLGRLIRRVDGDSRSLIQSTKLTKVFVIGDILAFLIQSGGMYNNNTLSMMKLRID